MTMPPHQWSPPFNSPATSQPYPPVNAPSGAPLGMQYPPIPSPLTARRWLARLIDWLLVLGATAPLWKLSGDYLLNQARQGAADVGRKNVTELLLQGWSGVDDELVGAATDLMGTVIWVSVGTFAVQILAVALYDWLLHAFGGRTLGKVITGITVLRPEQTARQDARTRIGLLRAAPRTAVTVLLPGLGWLLLLWAVISLSVVPALLGVVVLMMSVIESASVRSAPQGQTCWHDRSCGTVVVRVSWAQQLRQAQELQRKAATGVQHLAVQAWQAPVTQHAVQQGAAAAQRVWQAPPTQHVVTQTKANAQRAWDSDAAQRAVQQARSTAERIGDAPATQRALEKSKQLTEQLRNSRWGTAVGDRVQSWSGKETTTTPPPATEPPPSQAPSPDRREG